MSNIADALGETTKEAYGMHAIEGCEPQKELFAEARVDKKLLMATSRVLCLEVGDAGYAAAELLAEALIGFTASYGESHELGFHTVDKLLGMADEGVGESALDLMFKQVIEGVYYQRKHHQEPDGKGSMRWVGQWMKNPDREPEPCNPACVSYRAFKEKSLTARVRAVQELRIAIASLAAYPGYDEIAIALLATHGN